MRLPDHVAHAMREMFSGATFRALMDIRDAGEAFLAEFGADHSEVDDTTGGADIHSPYTDELTGHEGTARTHIPGGILFSIKEKGDKCFVIHPRGLRVPGAGILLHSLGGVADRVPAWLGQKVGLFVKKYVLRLESKDEAVEIQAGTGKDIVLNAGTKKVARVSDAVFVGTLAVTGAPGTTLTFTPYNSDGTPGTPIGPLPTVTIQAVISDYVGADHVKA